jgi:hypothetical protein
LNTCVVAGLTTKFTYGLALTGVATDSPSSS